MRFNAKERLIGMLIRNVRDSGTKPSPKNYFKKYDRLKISVFSINTARPVVAYLKM